MNKKELYNKILQLDGLTNEEKSELLGLLRKQKKYGLVWEDKPEDVEERLRDELLVLLEDTSKAIISDTPDAPNHILIEGDNLEALTTLAYTHEGKIDVIYIDPPYNTGKNDFVYNDRYVDSVDSYRHSKWLSFMGKRLRIAKQLLSDKGVIFISIDDNEQAPLKLLCDEIMGENNFIGQLILKTATDNNPSQINTEHEYMLCYAKSKINQGNWQRQSQAAKLLIAAGRDILAIELSLPEMQKALRKWIKEHKDQLPQVTHYNNIDSKGVYSSSSNSSNPHPGGYNYDIFHPITHLACPKPANGWRWPESTFLAYDAEGEIEWGKDHTTQPHVKKRIETSMEYLRTLIYEDNRGTTKALMDIFNGEKRFDNPKPHNVLSRIIDFASSHDSTILDFFAGSGTTLHATMLLNDDDKGHRKCILVTNNENNIYEQLEKQATNDEVVQIRHFSIIDEAHYMLDFDNRPLRNLIAVGRNKGLSIILATQNMSSFKSKGFDFYANAQYPLIMKQQTIDDKVIKDLFGVSGQELQEIRTAIAGLQKGELIIKDQMAFALSMGKKYKKINVTHLI